jgi:protein-S-isoprenylcysteine O-methyltransferase Ste14
LWAEVLAMRSMLRTVRRLIGSGDRIALMTMPVVIIGVAANLLAPSKFAIPLRSPWISGAAVVVLVVGVVGWASSVALILAKVPKGQLITGGPYAIVKHPLYTSVGLLVLPAAGVLLDTWLGAAIGATVYIASRRFAPDEEAFLANAFGATWQAYSRKVVLPWL